MQCYRCKNEIKTDRTIGRQQTCPHCDACLHCCLNCRFFDDRAWHSCREPQAELVQDKDSANFCDYFEPASEKHTGNMNTGETRRKLDTLFGHKQPASTKGGDAPPS